MHLVGSGNDNCASHQILAFSFQVVPEGLMSVPILTVEQAFYCLKAYFRIAVVTIGPYIGKRFPVPALAQDAEHVSFHEPPAVAKMLNGFRHRLVTEMDDEIQK